MKKRRLISFVLCLSLILTSVITPTTVGFAAEKSVQVTWNDKAISEITLEETQKEVLTAKASGVMGGDYQWQILLDAKKDIWVDVYDATERKLEVSYAVVKNMLDEAGSTYVRCAVTKGSETIYSEKVCVAVVFSQKENPQVTSYAGNRYVGTENKSATEKQTVYRKARAAEEPEFITITVKYLDIASLKEGAEESAIYSPYTARIERGTSFSQNVVSPTFIGFAPYLDSNNDRVIDDQDTDASTLPLQYTGAQTLEDIVIYVYYKPIEVDFAVKYFFQNINDDLYTEDSIRYHKGKAETGTIVTNDYLQSQAGDTTGFTKMYHIPESVAADGSTVFECYYDRNYFLVQFDLDGGYGVDPIYARYGAPFLVNTPVKHGYIFDGWQLVDADADGNGTPDGVLPGDAPSELTSTVPACSYYYKAKWTRKTTEYTVVYWLQNGTNADGDTKYDYLGSKGVDWTPGDAERVSGSDDLATSNICGSNDHTHTDSCKVSTKYYEYVTADTNVLVEGDGSTIVNVYYKPKEYTLKFYYAFEKESDHTYWVIGGSTYYFGGGKGTTLDTGTDTGNEISLLTQYLNTTGNAKGNIGQVDELPELNTTGLNRNYTLGSDTTSIGGATYQCYYISFTASYGQNISELWPCSVFQSVTRTEENTHSWKNKEAFVSAWNGEYNVWYSRHHDGNPSTENDNQTIKGNQEKLDYQMLFETEPAGYDNVVAYTCFWENGANIGWSVPELYVYKIWVPVVDGDLENPNDTTTVDGKTVETVNGVRYKLLEAYDTCDDSNVDSQTQPVLEGYAPLRRVGESIAVDSSLYANGSIVNFYYTCESNSFVMKNHGENVAYTEIPYGTKLSTLDEIKQLNESDNYAPTYPTNMEENAYSFGGWYTTEKCLPGTEYDLANSRMPAHGVILYAKWVPQTHKVNFFTTYDEMLTHEAGKTAEIYYEENVPHGDILGTVETPTMQDDSNLDLVFAGWFYMENGEKKAYSSLNMPINRNMNIFAEWSSHSPQPYRISYVKKSDKTVKVADDSTGYAYGGSTKTFLAKAGSPYNQLYSEYNSGWFPTVGSHSITIQSEADFYNPTKNVYTFEYVQATNITYTVRYVNKKTGEEVAKPKVIKTGDAVVTERFQAVADMVPDAFYKRLVLEVEDDGNGNYVGTENNVITFYYTPNETSAYYAVHFMLEKLNATDADRNNFDIYGNGGYEETGTHIEGIGEVDSTIYLQGQSISGFQMMGNNVYAYYPSATGGDPVIQKVDYRDTGYGLRIDPTGSELYFFYKRKEYPYVVNYYHYNTTTPVDAKNFPSEHGNAKYESTVSKSAKEIPGYTCVSADTQSIKIAADQNGEKGINVINFYYSPLQYTAEYKVVTEERGILKDSGVGGFLSNTIEVITGADELTGSVATANPYYEFVGWYRDAECTQPAAFDAGTNKFTPSKDEMDDKNRNIYYAKFSRLYGDLTITRDDDAKDDQVYVYKIQDQDTGEVYYVTIEGSQDGIEKSVVVNDLPLGNYTVTQQNGWTWRYTDPGQNVTLDPDGETVDFEQNWVKQWLNGNSPLVKNRKGGE